METKINNKALKTEALRLSLSACDITPVGPVNSVHRDFLKEWLSSGRHTEMTYMGNHFDKRCDPALLIEGTRYVVSVALNYYPVTQLLEDEYQFAWYAHGMGYHDLMREELTASLRFIQESSVPEPDGCAFCDTAPVSERYWTWHADFGRIGKNIQLITPRAGSAFFLEELFLNTEADTYDRPQSSRYGTCNRCLQACPTRALEVPCGLDAYRCLSHLTIKNKGEIPASIPPLMGNRIYGCDEYQKACPWNRFVTPCRTPELQSSPEFMSIKKED